MKALVTLAVLLVVLTAAVEGSSIGSVPHAPAFYAVTLDGDAPPASITESDEAGSRVTPEDLAAGLVMLSLFLALIAGNLLRWSGEPWKVEKVR